MEALRLSAVGLRGSPGKLFVELDLEKERDERSKYDEILTFVDLLGFDTALKSLKATYDETRLTLATDLASSPPPDDDSSMALAIISPPKASSSLSSSSLPCSHYPPQPQHRLLVSSDAFFRINLVVVFFLTVTLHKFALVTSTLSSSGDDYNLRYMSLSQTTDSDMVQIGNFFFTSAFACSSPASAVDELILQFRCLQELDELCPSFRPYLYNVTLLVFFKESRIGANFRLYFGAGLSIADMVTDIVMIIQYIQASNWGFARTMIIMLSLNLFTQLCLSVLQNLKAGRKEVLLELLFTITCIAPGVHAYRVASGQEKRGGHVIDARMLLISSKCLELVFESIPGLLLQLFAFLTLPTSSSFAPVSIAMSAMTTAFSVSVMVFDKDVDPRMRKNNPFFYGVFLDDVTSRSLGFFWLFVFSVAHVLNKALGVALFWATFGGHAVFAYYGAELVAFFGVKLARRDLMYWAPLEGAASQLAVLVARFATKILVDSTGFLQMRHPFDVGGVHYSLTLLWSQISAVLSVVLYEQFYKNEENKRDKIDAIELYTMTGSLVFVWAVSFYCFIKKINRKFLHTFFGSMTAPDYCVHLFRVGDDRIKMDVFGTNVLFWAPIRDEVRAYTHANWERWQREKPDWFTAHFISTVPDEFIPRVEKDRRRSSAFGSMFGFSGGSGRGSVKSTSKVAAEDRVEATR